MFLQLPSLLTRFTAGAFRLSLPIHACFRILCEESASVPRKSSQRRQCCRSGRMVIERRQVVALLSVNFRWVALAHETVGG